MTPKYVVYECAECGKLFHRAVKEVLRDDVDDCHVLVELLNDANGELEEFPTCPCLGGNPSYVVPRDLAE